MENGAAGEILGKSLRIQIQPNLNSILADKSHVVIGNVMVRAVRKADSERLEWCHTHQFTNLRRCNHLVTHSQSARPESQVGFVPAKRQWPACNHGDFRETSV